MCFYLYVIFYSRIRAIFKANECVLKTLFAFIDQYNYTDDDIYASLCFVRERWADFMGDGDFVLYHNKEKNFEVGDI